MDYFEDEWGGADAYMDPTPPAQPQNPPVQQQPIGHDTPVVTQAPAQNEAKKDPAHAIQNQTGYNHFGGFQDEWDNNDLGGTMSGSFADQEPVAAPEKKDNKPEVVQTKEEEKPAEPEEPRRSAPKKETRAPKAAQAERSEFIGSGTDGGWGKKNIQNLAKGPSKRRNNRGRKDQPARKAPIKTKPVPNVPVVATQMSAAPGSSQHQVTTDALSLPSEHMVVQSLMDKVRELELKVAELENRQIQQVGAVCTLNSTGKVNQDFHVIWDSTNHIIRPQKGLKLLEPEKVFLEVSARGLYQITFTTCGTNPQLIINGHVYAAARSSQQRDSRNVSSTTCVSIYLYLDERATIAGKVTDEIASENPCEHWMCVRLVHQGF